jgi:hypothetical protein
MKTKEAVEHILKTHNITRYKLATELGAHPPTVYQWVKRTRMSEAYAEKFKERFGITITDAV